MIPQSPLKLRESQLLQRWEYVNVTDRGIRLQKMPGEIKVRWHRTLPKDGEIRNATLSKDRADRYFVSLLVWEQIAQLEPISHKVSIDLGLHHFAIT